MKVPLLSKREITDVAERMLADFQKEEGHMIYPPIPVEDIIERHLNLNLDYVAMETRPNEPAVLGAIYIHDRLIKINTGMTQDRNVGRLAFTCAHEAGHWALHRRIVEAANRKEGCPPVILCRKKREYQPIEWQANYFAASLLMPEEAVIEGFKKAFGVDILFLHNIEETFSGFGDYYDPCADNWPFIADKVCRYGGFLNVSKQAMIFRLQELGRVKNLSQRALNWKNPNRSSGSFC